MQGKFIDINGINTHYVDQGEGPVVVLLHGAALAIESEFTWFRQIETLCASHRVIAFDQPGFGRTSMPAGGRYMGREQRAGHAAAFLAALDIRDAVLVGHSEGGYIAARLAIVQPELARAVVIVTSGSTAPKLGGSADDAWIAASNEVYSVGDITEESFIAGLKAQAFHWDNRMEALARANLRRALSTGHVGMMQDLPIEDTDMHLYVAVQERTIYPHLSDWSVPALLVWAADDPTVPVERGLALMRLLPGSDMLVLSNARHNVMHDRATEFAEAIQGWISQIDGRAITRRDRP